MLYFNNINYIIMFDKVNRKNEETCESVRYKELFYYKRPF